MANYLVTFFGIPYREGGIGPGFSANIETNSPKDAAKQAYFQMCAEVARRIPRPSINDIIGVLGTIYRTNIYRSTIHKGISAIPAYPEWRVHVKQDSGIKFGLDILLEKVR